MSDSRDHESVQDAIAQTVLRVHEIGQREFDKLSVKALSWSWRGQEEVCDEARIRYLTELSRKEAAGLLSITENYVTKLRKRTRNLNDEMREIIDSRRDDISFYPSQVETWIAGVMHCMTGLQEEVIREDVGEVLTPVWCLSLLLGFNDPLWLNMFINEHREELVERSETIIAEGRRKLSLPPARIKGGNLVTRADDWFHAVCLTYSLLPRHKRMPDG